MLCQIYTCQNQTFVEGVTDTALALNSRSVKRTENVAQVFSELREDVDVRVWYQTVAAQFAATQNAQAHCSAV